MRPEPLQFLPETAANRVFISGNLINSRGNVFRYFSPAVCATFLHDIFPAKSIHQALFKSILWVNFFIIGS